MEKKERKQKAEGEDPTNLETDQCLHIFILQL